MEKSTRFGIRGMSCTSCRDRIEKTLRKQDGIVSVKVAYPDAYADVVYDEKKVDLQTIFDIVEKLGYRAVQETKGLSVPDMIMYSAIIVALYVILQTTGVLNLLVPSQLSDSSMGYGMLFLIGLLTSVHCVSMCGGIVLTQCLSTASQKIPLRSPLLYNAGRVVSYTLMGLILGLTGYLLGGFGTGPSMFLQGLLKLVAGCLMFLMGLNMLSLFPWTAKFFAMFVRKRKPGSKRVSGPFVVGLLNAFMPCGPLQSMWIVALATASPLKGALSMFLFSLGTVPLMLFFGSVVSMLGYMFREAVQKIGGVLVVVLGLSMIGQGGSLSGCIPPDLLLYLTVGFLISSILISTVTGNRIKRILVYMIAVSVMVASCLLWIWNEHRLGLSDRTDTVVVSDQGYQEVSSVLDPGHYPNISVKAVIPVRWTIDAPKGSINGCNYRFVIPAYGIEHTFHEGENVIEFLPETKGVVDYSCWMGMIRGAITVT